MVRVVVVAEQVWASLAGRQHAFLSAVVLDRSVVDLTLHLYSAQQIITAASNEVNLRKRGRACPVVLRLQCGLAAGRPIKYEVPYGRIGLRVFLSFL